MKAVFINTMFSFLCVAGLVMAAPRPNAPISQPVPEVSVLNEEACNYYRPPAAIPAPGAATRPSIHDGSVDFLYW